MAAFTIRFVINCKGNPHFPFYNTTEKTHIETVQETGVKSTPSFSHLLENLKLLEKK